jgi:hypothetical protein
MLSSNGQLDFQLNSVGFCDSLMLDMIVQNTGGAALNILPAFCVDRVEFYSTESNSIVQTVYGNDIYFNLAYIPYDGFNRIALASGYSSSFGGVSLAAGATQEFYLHIPCWLDAASGVKLNALVSPMRLKVYFSSYGSDTPANVLFQQCDIISRGQLFTPEVEAKQSMIRLRDTLKYTFPYGARVMQSFSSMSANSTYDVQLTSFNGAFSEMFVVIRAAPESYANRTTFNPVLSLQLLDQNSTIVGIEMTDLLLRSHQTLNYPGWILNTTNGVQGLYVISFITGSALNVQNGNQTGLYQFHSNEILRVRTGPTWVSGAYNVYILGHQYANMIIDNGNLMVQII